VIGSTFGRMKLRAATGLSTTMPARVI